MKNVKILINLLIISLLLVSCVKKKETNNKDLILVSIHPYALIANQLASDFYEIKTLFPGNSSPHSYSPVPEDIMAINKAKIIFINGLELEKIFEKILHETSEKTTNLSEIFPQSVLISDNHEHHHNHSNHKHSDFNPHIWTDPQFIVDIARKMAESIISLNPQYKDEITKNLRTLESEIQIIDSKIKTNRQDIKEPSIIYFHNAFAYLNRRYSINTAALIQAFPGKEPSPVELANLKKIIENQKVNAIVTEPQFNPKSAEIIAKEFNLQTITLDPLAFTTQAQTIAQWLDITQKELFKGLR
ncbi:MAG: metal ABC transporter substrate-binding protein [Bacilli bacterium]|nr:metal ABC transporter substrate-binding protein [Bacilli bacterium]MDD4155430.1 metal ABC transporter substrate-binding protein [Candidatus Cloacimonadota bacterium]